MPTIRMSSPDLNEDNIQAVVDVLRSGRLALGPRTRAFEETLADLALNPDIVETLFERLTAIRIVEACQLAEAGVDVLRLGDDVAGQTGMLMSPTMWRRWLKPRLARIIEAAKAVKPDIHIFYHSDGDCRAIIPELIEIGVTVLNPIQPESMDPVEVKRRWGDRITLHGTISVTTTLPKGSPESVSAHVRQRITTCGRDGGLILCPANQIMPDTPIANVVAMYETAGNWRWNEQ